MLIINSSFILYFILYIIFDMNVLTLKDTNNIFISRTHLALQFPCINEQASKIF